MRRFAPVLASLLFFSNASAQTDAWSPFAETDVVEIVTTDGDGDLRETKVWIVVLDSTGYVRTNDSRWLSNIRRGSAVTIQHDGHELAVVAEEEHDPAVEAQIETAFKTKYGTMQRIMSFFRISDPTSLRLTAKTRAGSEETPGP